MAIGYLIAAIVAAAVAVFALQNSAQTSVRFLAWTYDGLPLAAVALIALGTGLVVAGLPLSIRAWRWRSRARTSEARVASLERALSEREQALLRKSPVPASPSPAPPPAQPPVRPAP
jgi:uncharacterized integral membrane protein